MAKAQVGTIHLRLAKIAAEARLSVRRIWVRYARAYPRKPRSPPNRLCAADPPALSPPPTRLFHRSDGEARPNSAVARRCVRLNLSHSEKPPTAYRRPPSFHPMRLLAIQCKACEKSGLSVRRSGRRTTVVLLQRMAGLLPIRVAQQKNIISRVRRRKPNVAGKDGHHVRDGVIHGCVVSPRSREVDGR